MLLGASVGVVENAPLGGSFTRVALAGAGGRSRRRRTEGETDGEAKAGRAHQEEWAELELLLEWPEQVEYEAIRPPGGLRQFRGRKVPPSPEPRETTLRRRISSFKGHGMRGLFEPEDVEGHSQLDPEVRGLDSFSLKSDYGPPMRDNEIATICYVRFGERPHGRTVEAGSLVKKPSTAIKQVRRLDPALTARQSGVTERRLARS